MSTYHAQQTWRANRPKTVVSNDLENPHFPYFYTSKSRFAYLQISLLPHFHTPTLPHYQVKTNVSKVKTHLHISRFAHFHTSTFPHFHISTLPHFHTSTLLHFHTFRLPDFRLPHYWVKIKVSKVTTRLYISRFAHALPHFQLLHFHTSTLPHYQVKIRASKLITHFHISRLL